ncbi:stage II sporulation protein D [Clostridium sp.]|uniref:stage II sporulation protein D n=1 Tax=Clostridium sp. TaxID=1506 RepID=UPI0025BC8788|nr:stage II sporulation protein D [Clostridium sp.]
MRKDFQSAAILSVIILIFMIVVPSFIIKAIPVRATDEKENDELEVQEDNYISLSGTDTIKVYITKEDKVVEVPIEEYVKSVVSGEMPAGFEVEALKAQSVAARTYVAAKRGRPCDIAKGGDVCDTTHCQVYIGKEERITKWEDKGQEYWDKISKAVDETKGKVLAYNKELVQYPQFFSTSSGMTENSKDVFSGDLPYLVSTESTGEEEVAPRFNGEVKLDINKFVETINSKFQDAKLTVNNLSEQINIISRSDAGGVKEIKVGEATVRGLDFRLAIGLNSTNFQYTISNDAIIFATKGYGHGVGMSQWGANVMAKNGSDYSSILKHYYTGIELEELKFNE